MSRWCPTQRRKLAVDKKKKKGVIVLQMAPCWVTRSCCFLHIALWWNRVLSHAFKHLVRSIAKELADWLIHNNVVEHIFGPNLHIEVSWCETKVTKLYRDAVPLLWPADYCVCVCVPDHQAVPGDPELLGCRGPTQHAARGLYLGCSSGEKAQNRTRTHAALFCQTVPAGRGCQIPILITVMWRFLFLVDLAQG